jgi:hypothetical protein
MRHSRPSPGPDMQVVAGFGLGVLGCALICWRRLVVLRQEF